VKGDTRVRKNESLKDVGLCPIKLFIVVGINLNVYIKEIPGIVY